MAQPRKFFQAMQVKLRPLDRSIVRYYSEWLNYDKARIIRSMIRRFAQYDGNLDLAKFKKWVEEVVMPEHEGDEELQAQLQRELELFINAREK